MRFLNSIGGGIVRRFKGKDQVWVEGEDGFEIPALIRELVVVESPEQQVLPHSKPRPAPVETPVEAPAVEAAEIKETPEGERLNVYLGYLPLEPRIMTRSGYEAFFINSSNYYLLFNYMSRQNNSWTSRYNGQVEPHTKIFMEEFGKEELNHLERVCVQLVAFKKDKPFLLKNALSVELRIDTVKFYKTHCFTENDFFEEDALIFPVVQADVPQREQPQPSSKGGTLQAMQRQPSGQVIEIDLHIEQLLDNTNGLSPADMLQYQIEKFHETLSQYAGQKGQSIVFIHGNGEGVLRSAIEKELKTRYKQYARRNASFLKYGFGATMVTIA